MTAPSKIALPGPEHAYWPFPWLGLYTQMARDVGRCAQSLSQCTDAMEALQAEGMLGLRLFDDLMRAHADLAAASWMAMASGLAEPGARIGPIALVRAAINPAASRGTAD